LRRRATFDSAARLRELDVLHDDGAPRWSAQFDDYEPVAQVPVAHRITLDVTTGASRVKISLRDLELNPELPPGIFQLRAPAAAGASGGEGG
jgi:hypothetical protein